MKRVKLGCIYKPMGHNVRAVKRTNGCTGCIYEKVMICPNSIIKNSKKEPIDCILSNSIFVKP